MADPYVGRATNISGADTWAAVTKSDAVDLPGGTPKALWVNVAGDLALVGSDGASAIFSVPAGVILPLRATRVLSTGTTATGIRALY